MDRVISYLVINVIPNEDILINGFSPEPLREDKPENSRNGGVCLYFKENLQIKERHDLESIPETIAVDAKLNHPDLPPIEFDEYMNTFTNVFKQRNSYSHYSNCRL